MKKFIAVLFLRNADYATYNDLLVEFRKSYANKLDIYPKNLEDVVDVMRQQPPKKRNPSQLEMEMGTAMEKEIIQPIAQRLNHRMPRQIGKVKGAIRTMMRQHAIVVAIKPVVYGNAARRIRSQ